MAINKKSRYGATGSQPHFVVSWSDDLLSFQVTLRDNGCSSRLGLLDNLTSNYQTEFRPCSSEGHLALSFRAGLSPFYLLSEPSYKRTFPRHSFVNFG